MSGNSPRFFYGWVLVGATFVTNAIAFATASFFSLLMVALQDEFHWGTTSIVAAYAISGIIFGLSCPLVGRLADRWPARAVMPIGSTALGLAMIGVSLIDSLWQLYLVYGVVSSVALVLQSPVTSVTVLQNWFLRRRGFALGLASAGGALGWMALAPISQYLISAHGWRFACQALGVLVILILMPLNLTLQRQRPQDVGLLPDNGEVVSAAHRQSQVIDHTWVRREWTLSAAMRTWRMWVIFLGLMLGVYINDSIRPHEASILVNAGYGTMLAATVIGAGSAAMAFGRALWGGVSDKIGREETGVAASFLLLVGVAMLFILQTHQGGSLVYAYSLFLGLGMGAAGTLFATISADLFQGRHFGTVYGFMSLAIGPGASAGPLITGFLFEGTGSYRTGLGIDAVAVVLMAICFWVSSPRFIRRVPGRSRAAAPIPELETAAGPTAGR